jgi:phosphoglycolate phosphatase-like HAD superfamily hydrolase
MIVFDADGTLIGGESTDWASFGAAFEEVAGFTLDDAFFASIEEITAKAIVHQALAAFPAEQRMINERAVCHAYLRRLKAACETNPCSFPAMEGALTLLPELKQRGIPVAIATGDWRETISFKLRAAGIPFDDIPMVTSSEFYSRADIIEAAVRKAGRSLDEAIYVGDGLWDLRACKKLGIPFLGVGHRRERLRAAGAVHTLLDLNPLEFWQAKEAAIGPNGFHRAQGVRPMLPNSSRRPGPDSGGVAAIGGVA